MPRPRLLSRYLKPSEPTHAFCLRPPHQTSLIPIANFTRPRYPAFQFTCNHYDHGRISIPALSRSHPLPATTPCPPRIHDPMISRTKHLPSSFLEIHASTTTDRPHRADSLGLTTRCFTIMTMSLKSRRDSGARGDYGC
jgi:hypothetical protein